MASPITRFCILGYSGCGYFNRAASLATRLGKSNNSVETKVKELSYDAFQAERKRILVSLGKGENSHTTSPLVYKMDDKGTATEFIGGCDSFTALVSKQYNM